MIKIDLGKLKLTYKGIWAVGVAYEADDVAYYNGSTYRCLANNTGYYPAGINIGVFWKKFAEGVDIGEQYTNRVDAVLRFKLLSSNPSSQKYMAGATTDNRVYIRGVTNSHMVGGASYEQIATVWRSISFPPERDGKVVTDIKTGYYSVFVLFSDGELWSWGHSGYGGTGLGLTADQYQPQLVKTGVAKFDITNMGYGQTYYFGALLGTDDQLYSWAYNGYGQLGLGNTTQTNSPQPVIDGDDVKDFAVAGSQHGFMAFIKNNGDLWTCGYNAQGNLGTGNATQFNSPQKINSMDGMCAEVYASCGHYNVASMGITTIRTTDNKIYCAGYNAHGQLGDGTTAAKNVFTLMNQDFVLYPVKSMHISRASYGGSFYIDSSDDLWAWGYNGYGQLGNGGTTSPSSPEMVHEDVKDCWITEGGYNSYTKSSMLRTTANLIKACGHNGNGCIGLRHESQVNVWTEVEIPFDGADIIQHACGGYSADVNNYFLTSDGFVCGAGYNGHGQIYGADQSSARINTFVELDR